MKVLYISSSPSEEEYKKIESKVKIKNANKNYGMPEASYKFHKLIIEGLRDNDCEIYSIIGRMISYKNHKGLIWKSKKIKAKKITYNHVFIINFPIIKQLLVCIETFFIGLFWLIKNRNNERLIIIDGAYVTLLPIVNLMCFFIPTNKIAIICDVYSYMDNVSDAYRDSNKIMSFLNFLIRQQYQKINGFVFLTEEMKFLTSFKNKPYVVIEGLSSSKIVEKKLSNNYIMYAGALNAEYGIKRLVEAFQTLKNKNINLLLFGNGNFVTEINKIEKLDKRIKYMGKKSLEEIYEYERNALLLVNPRPTDFEFTKYSFPSKTIEYMLSGTPLLTSKLSGIPKEYYNYVFTIEENSVESLSDSLSKIISMNKEELSSIGKKAQIFISQNKNNIVQSRKILDLVKQIHNN